MAKPIPSQHAGWCWYAHLYGTTVTVMSCSSRPTLSHTSQTDILAVILLKKPLIVLPIPPWLMVYRVWGYNVVLLYNTKRKNYRNKNSPYSRSKRHVWQTFFILLHVWHTSVFLNLILAPGHHLNTVNGRAHILHSFPYFSFIWKWVRQKCVLILIQPDKKNVKIKAACSLGGKQTVI